MNCILKWSQKKDLYILWSSSYDNIVDGPYTKLELMNNETLLVEGAASSFDETPRQILNQRIERADNFGTSLKSGYGGWTTHLLVVGESLTRKFYVKDDDGTDVISFALLKRKDLLKYAQLYAENRVEEAELLLEAPVNR